MRPTAFFVALLFVISAAIVFVRKQSPLPSVDLGERVGVRKLLSRGALVQQGLAMPRPAVSKQAFTNDEPWLERPPCSIYTNSAMSGVSDRLHFSKETVQERYWNSPARNTPECQAILKILTEHGYGLEYLEPAYILADQAHMLRDENLTNPRFEVSFDGEPYDASNPEHARRLDRTRRFDMAHERFKLGQLLQVTPENESMLDKILQSEPKAPYIDIYKAAGRPKYRKPETEP